MGAGHLGVLLSAAVTLTVMVVAAGLCFKPHGRSPRGLNVVKGIGPVSVAASLWLLWVATPPSTAVAAVGFACFAVALAVFLWALWVNRARWLTRIYCDDVPDHLVDAGPYRLVRHPCYSAYVLVYTGALVASRSVWLIPVVVINAALYWHAARTEEQKFTDSPLAADYAAYRRRTGMLLPNPIKMLRRSR